MEAKHFIAFLPRKNAAPTRQGPQVAAMVFSRRGLIFLDQRTETAGDSRLSRTTPEGGSAAVNAWSAMSTVAEPAAERPPRLGARRLRLLVSAAGAVVAFAALAIANASVPPPAAAPVALREVTQIQVAPRAADSYAPATHAAPQDADSVRITGTVGADLTRSLQAAGVPEKQGRDYVAALASAINLSDGLSVADRFDLVILREDGRLGEVAYAGLDRVGRSDVQLMKWTDGKEIRWINADGFDASSQGMGMPVVGRVSSGFGQRFHPVLGHRRMHKGVDLAAPSGAPIVAAASGRVVAAGWHGGYGRQVAIAHDDGLKTTYSHMSAIAAVRGAHVRQGEVIGYVGSSGLSTGPHLHYEVYRNGRLVNPLSVKLRQSPLQGEELHAFRSRLRGLLMSRGRGV